MRIALLFLTFLFAGRLSSASIDTISIHVDSTCSDFMPRRVVFMIPCSTCGIFFEEEDSIRVGRQIINEFGKEYYLIVYQSGMKRMEGHFRDQYACGHCINYYPNGRIRSEGNYKVKVAGRKHRSVKTGTWTYYNSAGVPIQKETLK